MLDFSIITSFWNSSLHPVFWIKELVNDQFFPQKPPTMIYQYLEPCWVDLLGYQAQHMYWHQGLAYYCYYILLTGEEHQSSAIRSRSEPVAKDTDFSLVVSTSSDPFCFAHPLPPVQLQISGIRSDLCTCNWVIWFNSLFEQKSQVVFLLVTFSHLPEIWLCLKRRCDLWMSHPGEGKVGKTGSSITFSQGC